MDNAAHARFVSFLTLVVSFLTLAVQIDGQAVTTIEGLSPVDGDLHPMQQSFIDHNALPGGPLGSADVPESCSFRALASIDPPAFFKAQGGFAQKVGWRRMETGVAQGKQHPFIQPHSCRALFGIF